MLVFWTGSLPLQGQMHDRIDSTVTSTQQIQDIIPSHSTVFIFSRTSELGTLPLVSTLEISVVTLPLNGSTITCMADSLSAVATTTVHIVGENDDRFKHRHRNHGGSGGWCPAMFSNNYIIL